MRRIPARIRFAPRTGLRKSAVAPRRCMWRWHFYNRSSAVFLHATSFYNRTSAVFLGDSLFRWKKYLSLP